MLRKCTRIFGRIFGRIYGRILGDFLGYFKKECFGKERKEIFKEEVKKKRSNGIFSKRKRKFLGRE